MEVQILQKNIAIFPPIRGKRILKFLNFQKGNLQVSRFWEQSSLDPQT